MHLAELNIAKVKYPLDSLQMKPFVDNLEPVNQLAEDSPDFVWRLKDESNNATAFTAFDDSDLIVNLSVWKSIDGLKDFMFRTHHKDFMTRKKEWFEPLAQASYVLWWVEEGHIPSVEEALARLVYLRENGESAYAFSFKKHFEADQRVADEL